MATILMHLPVANAAAPIRHHRLSRALRILAAACVAGFLAPFSQNAALAQAASAAAPAAATTLDDQPHHSIQLPAGWQFQDSQDLNGIPLYRYEKPGQALLNIGWVPASAELSDGAAVQRIIAPFLSQMDAAPAATSTALPGLWHGRHISHGIQVQGYQKTRPMHITCVAIPGAGRSGRYLLVHVAIGRGLTGSAAEEQTLITTFTPKQ